MCADSWKELRENVRMRWRVDRTKCRSMVHGTSVEEWIRSDSKQKLFWFWHHWVRVLILMNIHYWEPQYTQLLSSYQRTCNISMDFGVQNLFIIWSFRISFPDEVAELSQRIIVTWVWYYDTYIHNLTSFIPLISMQSKRGVSHISPNMCCCAHVRDVIMLW